MTYSTTHYHTPTTVSCGAELGCPPQSGDFPRDGTLLPTCPVQFVSSQGKDETVQSAPGRSIPRDNKDWLRGCRRPFGEGVCPQHPSGACVRAVLPTLWTSHAGYPSSCVSYLPLVEHSPVKIGACAHSFAHMRKFVNFWSGPDAPCRHRCHYCIIPATVGLHTRHNSEHGGRIKRVVGRKIICYH